MSIIPNESLTNTLVLALSQCQAQVRTIQDQSARIERLHQDNEKLRKELEDVRQARLVDVEEEPRFSVDELFRKNVEAQAEILALKKKLKAYKEKANKRLSAPISSPLVTPLPSSPKGAVGTPRPFEIPRDRSPSSPRQPTAAKTPRLLELSRNSDDDVFVRSSSPPRKRAKLARNNDREPLHELSVNATRSRTSSTSASKRGTIEKKVAAIPLLAEDGENALPEDGRNDGRVESDAIAGSISLKRDASMYRRLGGLLAAPSPDKAPLSRARSASPSRDMTTFSTGASKVSNISNIRHTPTETSDRPLDRHSSSRTRTSLNRSFKRGPEDDEPLRARPLSRLSLQHFKPNPRWMDSHGVSYDEFLHGRNGDRINALAETLPHLPGQSGHGGQLTDDEILREYMGSDSESRIAAMTSVARKNLVAEARRKRVAQAFAKQRIDYDHEDDAPGFWSTDMPTTQEERANRQKAKEKEREEIERRYEGALAGYGRWIFADE